MAKVSKKEREQARQYLCEAVVDSKPTDHPDVPANGTVLVVWCSGEPTGTGRTDRYRVYAVTANQCEARDISRLVAKAHGIRLNKDGLLIIAGCGFNKAHDIAHTIAYQTGHPVRVSGDYSGVVSAVSPHTKEQV